MELELAGYATFVQIIQITAVATCFIYWKKLKEGGIPLPKFCLIQILSWKVKLCEALARTRGKNLSDAVAMAKPSMSVCLHAWVYTYLLLPCPQAYSQECRSQ